VAVKRDLLLGASDHFPRENAVVIAGGSSAICAPDDEFGFRMVGIFVSP
jgi:hypothetical protein